MAEHATHDGHDAAHESHGTKFYWIIGAILAVVTALEVGVFLVQASMSEGVFLVILLTLALKTPAPLSLQVTMFTQAAPKLMRALI